MAVYNPLFVYLTPASIPQVVAHIQKYLADNPIVSDPEAIAEVIQKYIEEHPEIIAVASVNGKTGNVVLTGSDININASSAVSLETQLLNLASMIQSASGDITQIEAHLETIYTNIGTLETNVSNNTTAISALQTSVEGQGTRIATAETDIDNLETAQTAQGTRINTAEGNISSLQTRMTQAETDIDNNDSDIATLQTNVQRLMDLDDWSTESNYTILPNGLKIAWGSISTTVQANSIGSYIVTLPIQFSSFEVFLTNRTTTTAVTGDCSIAYGASTANTFEIRVYNTDSSSRSPSVQWMVIGY